ncbi:Peptidase_M13_N domain-containing protein [Caenorhabditis elegans]|uniref:Peptidase_M13_N domain-containing protein n=1 Tax=Caenorhabditis elegans TaxID=6239 RepID=Q564R5_CAEEL|nr:Peptidase_M13_N domain-containing protein [Caenorhabditis elegans]CAI79168.1 Peptidase_M13_N domain-containing protein [Caenorhabditis elegans]|eukprot:NP_001023788.1 Uncharacterized protein CELE_F11A5.16 [Caenorhabditis elegans]
MGLLWIDPESPFDQWTPYEYYWSAEQRKTVRSSIQQLLYHHQAKKNYINFLCKTAVNQNVLNKADAEKISKIYWKLDSFNSFDYTQSMLFDPKYSEYTKKNVDSKGVVKLKAISEKYLEDPKQDRRLRWKYVYLN